MNNTTTPPPELVNRTRSYFVFIFKTFGTAFYESLGRERFSIINLYIRDHQYEREQGFNHLEEPKIYLRLRVAMIKDQQDLFARLHSSRYFRDQYTYQVVPTDEILVFDLPAEYRHTYFAFLKGAYSRMYSPTQLRQIGLKRIVDGKIGVVYCVLHGLPDRYDFYQNMVQKHYNVDPAFIPKVEELREYDVLWEKKHEILHYNPHRIEDFIQYDPYTSTEVSSPRFLPSFIPAVNK